MQIKQPLLIGFEREPRAAPEMLATNHNDSLRRIFKAAIDLLKMWGCCASSTIKRDPIEGRSNRQSFFSSALTSLIACALTKMADASG